MTAARQLEVFDRRHEKDAAGNQRDEETEEAPAKEAARVAKRERRECGPTRQQEEERHVPEADEAASDQHHEGVVRVADVVEGRRIEDHSDVEEEDRKSTRLN